MSFHRLVMPDGRTYSLDRFKGLGQIGDTGLKDSVNRHYLQVFGASLAIGALSGLAQYGIAQQRRFLQLRRFVPAGHGLESRGVSRTSARSVTECSADDHDPRGLPHQGLSHERSRLARLRRLGAWRCPMKRAVVSTHRYGPGRDDDVVDAPRAVRRVRSGELCGGGARGP